MAHKPLLIDGCSVFWSVLAKTGNVGRNAVRGAVVTSLIGRQSNWVSGSTSTLIVETSDMHVL